MRPRKVSMAVQHRIKHVKILVFVMLSTVCRGQVGTTPEISTTVFFLKKRNSKTNNYNI